MAYHSKAVRIADELERDLGSGVFACNRPLPPEDELMSRYAVARGTVRKILKALEERGVLERDRQKNLWVVDRAAKEGVSPATRRRIGVLMPGNDFDHFFCELLEGIQAYADECELTVHCLSFPAGGDMKRILATELRYHIGGLLLPPLNPDTDLETLRELAAQKVPLVALDRSIPQLELPLVQCNNFSGMLDATALLIRRYQRPVHYFGPENFFSSRQERYQGYCEAMRAAGWERFIGPNTRWISHQPYPATLDPAQETWYDAYRDALLWLPELELPASIVTTDDYSARGIYEAAAELKLPIGTALRLFSFGNLPMTELLRPSLSSVMQNNRTVGYEACRLLHGIMEGAPAHLLRRIVPVRLIERESTPERSRSDSAGA